MESNKLIEHFHVGFCALELSKLVMYEKFSWEMQPYFGAVDLELQYMDLDSFLVLFKTLKG